MSAKRARLARWLGGDGIEVGALHQPLQVPAEAHVTYVDHLPMEKLREHYPELAALPLTPVDVIGTAEDLSAFPDDSLDFVIANHLLEHLEYPARGLREFQRVLRPGGVLYLALPDKRRTFDHERQLTTVEHLVAEDRDGSAEANRREHYLDWAHNVDGKDAGDETERHADELMAIPYSIHFHVWRPDTFIDFLAAARRELGLQLQLVQFAALEDGEADNEFILLLGKPNGDEPILPKAPPPDLAVAPDQALEPELGVSDLIFPGRPDVKELVRDTPLAPPLRAARRRILGR